jgi:hypothetical protein
LREKVGLEGSLCFRAGSLFWRVVREGRSGDWFGRLIREGG